MGRGGSSKVYKVMAPNRKIFALKRIRLGGRDAEAASGFLDEIRLLDSLAGRSNIIQLVDSEVCVEGGGRGWLVCDAAGASQVCRGQLAPPGSTCRPSATP